MSTRRTIEQWVELFNAGDAEGISALYADDAVNHQIALEPVVGQAAIEQFHRDTFAGGPLTCTPINLVVDGDWGALEWIDPDGFRGVRVLSRARREDRAPAGLLGQRTAQD